MSLRIGTLAAHCRVPGAHQDAAAMLGSVAREVLPQAIAARLGPSLEREAPIVRLRRLDVRLRIDAVTVRRGGLADAWASALVVALHQALARPDGERDGLVRFPSRPAYLAAMAAAVLTGAPGAVWQFSELAGRTGRPTAMVVLELLLQSGALIGDVLAELHGLRLLDAALAALDEVGLERVMRAVAAAEGGTGALDTEQTILIATTLGQIAAAPLRGDAAGRRQAIRLWLRLGRTLPLRGTWNALRLLLRIVEAPTLLAPPAPLMLQDLPPWCEAVLSDLARGLTPSARAALEQLRRITPTAALSHPNPAEPWIALDCAGLLLLYETLHRLGWVRQLQDGGHDPRTVQALLAGIGMRMLSRPPPVAPWGPGDAIEPAAAILSGLFAEPSRIGIARVFAETPPELDFAPALEPSAAGNWPKALDAAADRLAAAFASRIRGFRGAPRQSVVQHFLRVPGRILVEKSLLRVVLQANPFAVAVSISGAAMPTPPLDWLGGRRVEFVMEGL